MKMMFKLTTLSSQGQWRVFNLRHHDLEVVYEVLHILTRKGNTMVNVTLIDENGYLPLPLEALEEATFSNPIGELRQQWETILDQPIRGYLCEDEFKQRLIGLRQERMVSIRRTLSHTQELLERSHQLKEGSGKTRLINYYQRMLDRYSRLLLKLETDS